MEKSRALLLLSGGIDSTTLLAKLSDENKEVIAISFFYDQKHAIELEYAKKQAKRYNVVLHKIIQLDSQLFSNSALVNSNKYLTTYDKGEKPDGQQNAYVPFRNLMFISMALSFAENQNIPNVYVAFNNDDCLNYWDCTNTFLSKLNVISEQNDIKIHAPLINLTKKEVVNLAQKLGVNLDDTISCYQPIEEKECGKCFSCISKKNAINIIKSYR